jgi:subtilisin family serine protease
MKKIIYIVLALFLASCGTDKTASISTDTGQDISSSKLSLQSVLSNMDKESYRDGEVLVKFKPGVLANASLSAHQLMGASVEKTFTLVPNLELARLPEGMSVSEAVVQYMSDPNVEYAEPNYVVRASATMPNDTFFDQQWGLMNTGLFAGGTYGADINAPGAWDISRTTGVIIAIIDTGIFYNHADLVGNIWINSGEICTDGIDNDLNGFIDDCRGWDFVGTNVAVPTADNNPIDDNGHGTHVAGIAGAVGNNGAGISGLLWSVQLMPLKVLDTNGFGNVSEIIGGVNYAVANGARVMNASLGTSVFSSALFDAINAANTAGVLLIASAGNGGADFLGDNNDLSPQYPASYNLPNIISVAATDQNDMRASFSNFGLNSVDVAAPGVYILSTIIENSLFSLCTGSRFAGLDFCEGTSMAAPHVSALAGLLYSYYTNFTHSQIRSTILRYVDVLSELNGWIQTGGRVNAYSAMSSLLIPTNLVATATSSSEVSLSWTDNATGEDGYRIERDMSGGGFAQIADIGPNSTSYYDSGLAPLTTYSYRVIAYNNIGVSPTYSNIAAAITLALGAILNDGGSNCSISTTRPNTPTAVADVTIMLIPLIFIAIVRLKRKYRD